MRSTAASCRLHPLSGFWGNCGRFITSVLQNQFGNRATVTECIRCCLLKGVFIATQLNSTKLNSTAWTTVAQFVGRDVTNKNTTDLAVRCSIGSVELSWVELCRYKHPLTLGKCHFPPAWRRVKLKLYLHRAPISKPVRSTGCAKSNPYNLLERSREK